LESGSIDLKLCDLFAVVQQLHRLRQETLPSNHGPTDLSRSLSSLFAYFSELALWYGLRIDVCWRIHLTQTSQKNRKQSAFQTLTALLCNMQTPMYLFNTHCSLLHCFNHNYTEENTVQWGTGIACV
jgi:hypothetical protein